MKQYYLHNGRNILGPFSTEELKEKNITRETFVWQEDQQDWLQANEIHALGDIFGTTLPFVRAEFLSVSIF